MLIVFEVFLCSPADFLCGGWYVFSQKLDKLVELISFRFPSATALCRLLGKINQRDLSNNFQIAISFGSVFAGW